MLFDIMHRTEYRYGQPASEACLEARLTPPDLPAQQILSHQIRISPEVALQPYDDSFGNRVSFFAIGRRHERLVLVNRLKVRTHPVTPPADALDLTVAESRQILSSGLVDIFEFLQPTASVPVGGRSRAWSSRFIKGNRPLGEALEALNTAVHDTFRYQPGVTENTTPLNEVWEKKAGVCQDFAQVMLGVLRTAGLPARYVCGYIESAPPEGEDLVGSVATHAWVEALIPGMQWVGLDPTNNKWCGPQHVTMTYGRDFADAAPVRGTFKGSSAQHLSVKVTMKRLKDSTPSRP